MMKGKEFWLTEEFKTQLTSEINPEQILTQLSKIDSLMGNVMNKTKHPEARIGCACPDIRSYGCCPKEGFKYVKQPESFWSTANQLNLTKSRIAPAVQSFMEHNNLLSRKILDYVDDVRSLSDLGDDQTVNTYLPLQLTIVQQSAKRAASLVQAAADRLNDVTNIIGEIQSVSNRGFPDIFWLWVAAGKARDACTKMANFWQTISNN